MQTVVPFPQYLANILSTNVDLLQVEHAADNLQIVFDAVVDFFEQDLAFPQCIFELLIALGEVCRALFNLCFQVAVG